MDGPACEFIDPNSQRDTSGELSRFDGSDIIHIKEGEEYWIEGIQYSKEAFEAKVKSLSKMSLSTQRMITRKIIKSSISSIKLLLKSKNKDSLIPILNTKTGYSLVAIILSGLLSQYKKPNERLQGIVDELQAESICFIEEELMDSIFEKKESKKKNVKMEKMEEIVFEEKPLSNFESSRV